MFNIDAIIFAKEFTNDMEKEGLFDSNLDPFLDKEFFYEELLTVLNTNMNNSGELLITEQEFDDVIKNSRLKAIEDTFDGLIHKGIMTPKSMTPDGEIICGISSHIKISKKI